MGSAWSVREGGLGEFDGPEITTGFHFHDREPRLGDFFVLPDGSGPWRVVDQTVAGGLDETGNVLVVELFGD